MSKQRRVDIQEQFDTADGANAAIFDFDKLIDNKTIADKERLQTILENNFMFQNLSIEQKQLVIKAMTQKNVKANEVVIEEGMFNYHCISLSYNHILILRCCIIAFYMLNLYLIYLSIEAVIEVLYLLYIIGAQGNEMYIIDKGEFEVLKKNEQGINQTVFIYTIEG